MRNPEKIPHYLFITIASGVGGCQEGVLRYLIRMRASPWH